MGQGEEEEAEATQVAVVGRGIALADVVHELEDLAEHGDVRGSDTVERLRACVSVVVAHAIQSRRNCDLVAREDRIGCVVRVVTAILMIGMGGWIIREILRQGTVQTAVSNQIAVIKGAQERRLAQLVEFQKLRALPVEQLRELRDAGLARAAPTPSPRPSIVVEGAADTNGDADSSL